MSAVIQNTIVAFDKATAEARSLFSNLTPQQLNWKSAPNKWSIAQCLDHLIVSNNTYLPQFDEIIAGKHKNSFYQGIGFISDFFGNYLLREAAAVVKKPMKSPPPFVPAQSEIPGSIVADFEKHQQQFTAKLLQLQNADLDKTILSSPALGIITYSLRYLLNILGGHEQRHLTQAKNVLSDPNFPK